MPKLSWAKIAENINNRILLLTSLTAVFGAGIYYFYSLNQRGIILSLILIVAGFYFFKNRPGIFGQTVKNTPAKKIATDAENEKKPRAVNKKNILLILGYVIFYSFLFFRLWSSQSERALISPWEVVNYSFFWCYGLSSLILIFILINKEIGGGLKKIFLSLHFFLSFAVAIIIYKIGYGYDSFVHQATMELIAAKGLVLPKPPYYLGEYSLIVILHKISGLSIYFLNKILVPGLAALFLPTAFFRFFKNIRAKEADNSAVSSASFLAILFLLILTFSPFIVTTPQNLSYLFLILTVLAGFSRASLPEILILTAATAAIHPLTGLPALGWTAWLVFKKYQTALAPVWQKIIKFTIFLFTALALPFALFFTGGGGLKKIDGGSLLEPIKSLFASLSLAGREDWLLNFVYFFAANYNLWLIIAIGGGLWYFYGRRRKDKTTDADRGLFNGLIFINLSLLIAYLLSGRILFNDLIGYEQAGYAGRILIIMVIFFLPFILVALRELILKIWRANPAIQTSWLIFGVSLLTASLYVSYPRFDKYFNSRGYSTSRNDIAAVLAVDRVASGPYIALANQPVSAAALQSFGFDHYYQGLNGQIYFYPIPTGGALYQYYLDMVYKNPDRQTILKALDLVGVDEGYLIVNKYWYQSGRVINEAKLTADDWQTINNEVYIFQYER